MARYPDRRLRSTIRRLQRRISELESRLDAVEGRPLPPPAEKPVEKAPRLPAHLTSPTPATPPPPVPLPKPLPQPVMPVVREIEPPRPIDAREVFLDSPTPQVDAPEKSGSLEVDLATRWLPRIGGVLLLIGAAIGAAYIQPSLSPMGRVAFGYLLALVAMGAGWFTRGRSVLVGNTLVAIGLAMGYFVSFASYFVPPMRVYTQFFPALVLMIGFAGTLVVCADRWRAQAFAGFGLLLGVLAALVSAPASQSFSLVALGGIALAAGVLLVRREWTGLTTLAMAATYLSSLFLWVFFPVYTTGEMAGHLAALLFHHVVFLAAFMRWSRPWMAREEAMRTAAAEHALPEMPRVAGLPFSSSFAMINSLALIALATLFFRIHSDLWEAVGALFFVLAAMEAVRLFIPRLNKGVLWNFHLLTATGLITGGLVAELSGLEMAAAMALQTLILSIAASLSPALRVLKPLTLIPAILTLPGLLTLFGGGGFTQLGGAVTGTLILLSALPWGRLLGAGNVSTSGRSVLQLAEHVSGALRSILGAVILFVAIGIQFGGTELMAPLMLLAAVSLVAVMGVLSARAWTIAVLGFSGLAVLSLFFPEGDGAVYTLIILLPTLILFRLWRDEARSRAGHVVAALLLLTSGMAMLAAVAVSRHMEGTWPVHAAFMMLAAGGFVGMNFIAPGMRLPRLFDEEESEESGNASPPPNAVYSPLLAGGFLLAGFAVLVAIIREAPVNLLSPVLASSFVLAGWLLTRHAVARPVVFGVALVTLLAGFNVHGENAPWTVAVWLAIVGLAAGLLMSRHQTESRVAFALMPVAYILLLVGLFVNPLLAFPAYLTAVACAVAGLLLPMVVRLAERRGLLTGDSSQTEFLVGKLTVLVSLILLTLWARDTPLAPQLITAAWGLTGFVVLGLGFLLREKTMRFVSIGILVLTTARVFLVDLAQADMGIKIIAFLVTGAVFILAGMAYVFLKGRVGR